MTRYSQPNLGSYTLEEAMHLDISASEIPPDTKVVPVEALLQYMQDMARTIRYLENVKEEMDGKVEELEQVLSKPCRACESIRKLDEALGINELAKQLKEHKGDE